MPPTMPGALLEPVDRRQQDAFDLLPPRRLLGLGAVTATTISRSPAGRRGRARPPARRRARPDRSACRTRSAPPRPFPPPCRRETRSPSTMLPSTIEYSVAVEGAHGRARYSIALEVVGAAVAGAGEVRRIRGDEPNGGLALERDLLRGVQVGLPAGLRRAAEVDAAVGDDREARQAVGRQAVVADERGAVGDLALLGIGGELRHAPLTLREVRHGAEVDVLVPLADERRGNREADHRDGDSRADDRSEPERRALEEHVARIALRLLDLSPRPQPRPVPPQPALPARSERRRRRVDS